VDLVARIPFHAELFAVFNDAQRKRLAVAREAVSQMIFRIEHPRVPIGAEKDDGAEPHHPRVATQCAFLDADRFLRVGRLVRFDNTDVRLG